MASAKFGAIVTDVRGKLGGHVFQGNGLTTSLRTSYSGKGGLRARANIYENMNDVITKNYNASSLADKKQWDLLGQKLPIIDAFGQQKTLTGQNLYRRNYTAFYSSGQVGYINPFVAISDLPSSSVEYMEFRTNVEQIELQFKDDLFSDAVIIYGKPVSNPNLKIDGNKLPFLYGLKDETPDDHQLWIDFFVKYPDYIIGTPVQFGIVQVNRFGFQSFVKTIYAIFDV